MKMDNKKEFPKRKDIRLKNYDYSSPGAYFVTICTKNRKNYLWNGSIDPQKFNWYSVVKPAVIRCWQYRFRRVRTMESNISCGITTFLCDYAESPTYNGCYF